MSYDFYAFLPIANEDVETTAMNLLEDCEDESDDHDPAPQDENRKRSLAQAIIKNNPQMIPFTPRHDQIAQNQTISIDEAQKRYRYIELNGPEPGNGVQITLHDRYATITVPYWHQGTAAHRAFAEIWNYLRILHITGGYVAYDPQLERILNLDQDQPNALNMYLRVVPQVKGNSANADKPRKSWWKFW